MHNGKTGLLQFTQQPLQMKQISAEIKAEFRTENGFESDGGMAMLFTSNLAETPFAKDPAVVRLGERYFLYYSVFFGDTLGIGMAFSDDMERWQEYGRFPTTQECESTGVGAPGAIVRDGKVHLFYQTYGTWEKDAICHAWSEDGLHFEKDESNPVFRPTADWCCGRAIDADVCRFKDRYYLYFATRDHEMRIQKLGAAWTPLTSDFSRDSWTQACRHAILAPEMVWEQECTEAPACVVDGERLYLFYGGAYNRKPQQIGCAVSEDGIHFEKMDSLPFLTNGEPGSWNAEESGHPFAFRDTDGTVWLFYQGFDGETWRITRTKLDFRDGRPVLVI